MVTRKRTKAGVRNAGGTGGRSGPSMKLKSLLHVGDWLDVLDLDGVWNVARVLSVPSPGEVEITYDGWPKDYDEVVRIDSERVAPYHTFTKPVKCWVKYLNWPLWPSVITIRTPGTPEGVRNLMAEHRVHVDFFDNPDFSKRDRCWQKKGSARAFESNYDAKRTASTGEQFERALGWVLQSDASTKMPKFAVGTLPIEFKDGSVDCVETVRRNMGDELWFQSFTQNRMLHRMCHVYETMGDEEEEGSSCDDALPPKPAAKVLDLSVKKEPPVARVEKKRPAAVKIELDLHTEREVPYELEPIDSSGSDDSDSSQDGNRSKRRRLQTRPRSTSSSKTKSQQREEERRMSRPQTSKDSRRLARGVTTNKEKRAKGLVKIGARRSIPPVVGFLNLTSSDEPVAIQPSESLSEDDERYEVEKEPPLELYTAINSRDEAVENDDCDRVLVSLQSTKKQERQMGKIEKKIADAEEKLRALIEEKEKDEQRVSITEQARSKDPSPSAADAHGRPQLISPSAGKVKKQRSKRAISELSVPTSSQTDKLRKDKKSSFFDSAELDNSLVSASKNYSSDSEESKGTADENAAVGPQIHVKSEDKADAKPSSTEVSVDSRDVVNTDDAGEKGSQEQRERLRVMKAAEKDVSPVAEAEEKATGSRKTVIAVPRKFDEGMAPRKRTDSTKGTLQMAPPPRLRVNQSVSGGGSGVALASPSTAVFSSSKGFSMNSWFKRKLVADFMASGSPPPTER